MLHDALVSLRHYFQGRPELRKIASNAGWLVVDNVIRIIGAVFVGAWMARYLGVAQFAEFNLAFSFTLIFGPLIKLTLDSVIVRDLARRVDQRDQIMGSAFLLRVVASALALPLMVVIIMLLRPQDTVIHGMVVLFGIAWGIQSFEVIDLWMQSQVISRYAVYARRTAFAIATGARILCIVLQAPLIAFAWMQLLESALYVAGLLVVYRHNGQSLRLWKPTVQWARPLLRDSLPLMVTGFTAMLYFRIDQVIMAQILPEPVAKNAVGVYAAAVRLSEFWYFVPAAIAASVAPSLVKIRQDRPEEYARRAQRLHNLLSLLGYAAAIAGTLLADPIVSLYGEDYLPAVPMLRVLMWAGIWVCLEQARFILTANEGVLTPYMFATMMGAAVNIGLNLVLIPAWQGMGAAIATFTGYAVATYISSLILPRFRHFGRMMTRALLYPNPLR
jgi:PST family polysaccharide transporter